MDLNDFQKQAQKSANYPKHIAWAYLSLGLSGEAGETLDETLSLVFLTLATAANAGKVAELTKKMYRSGGNMIGERREKLKGELGDQLWYVALLAYEAGFTLDEIAETLFEKLNARVEEGYYTGGGGE
jgi:NTP pyrophosphatase (non-canonical NTP hydrolase)